MPPVRCLIAPADAPLFALPYDVDGEEYVIYTTDDVPATDEELRDALAAIGSCSDLEWESWAEELDRIRHESTRTPPIDDL